MTESDHQPEQPRTGWSSSSSGGWDQPPIVEITSEAGQWDAPSYSGEPAADPQAGYPQAGYPQAGYLPAGYLPAGYPVLPVPPAKRGKLPLILGALVTALLLAISGGAYATYQVLNGGGTQPDEVVPAAAIAFAKLDLNPSAGQKVAAARFLGRVPKLNTGFSSTGDWRKPLFDALANGGALPADVNFDRDIKPWLGKRLAVAVLPAETDGRPDTVLAVQSTDDAKARAGIARFGHDYGISFLKGYAILSSSQAAADRLASQAKADPLSSASTYTADMHRLGPLGVSSGWLSMTGLSKLAAAGPGMITPVPLGGDVAYTVRFSANTVELLVKASGSTPATAGQRSSGWPSIGDLPASTALAAQASTDSHAIDKQWNSLEQQFNRFADPTLGAVNPLDQLRDQFGLDLPHDLDTLLGTDQLVAVDSAGLDSDTAPRIAVRTHTNGPAAVAVLDKIKSAVGGSFPLTYRTTSDGVAATTDPAYLDSITAPSGARLSGLAGFGQALPDLSGAQFAGYLNLDAVLTELRKTSPLSQDLQQLASFHGLGITARADGAVSTLRVRLVER